MIYNKNKMKKHFLFIISAVAACMLSCGDTNPNDDENNRDFHGYDQSGRVPVNENTHAKRNQKDQTSTTGGGGSSVVGKNNYKNADRSPYNDNINDPDAGASSNMDTVPLRKK